MNFLVLAHFNFLKYCVHIVFILGTEILVRVVTASLSLPLSLSLALGHPLPSLQWEPSNQATRFCPLFHELLFLG